MINETEIKKQIKFKLKEMGINHRITTLQEKEYGKYFFMYINKKGNPIRAYYYVNENKIEWIGQI